MCIILSIKIFIIITLLVFNVVIKLHHFGVIRLSDSSDYNHKVQVSNNICHV